jgi:hypothetical protein
MNSNQKTIECFQCGETQTGIKGSQRSGKPAPCETEDDPGRGLHYKRHKFVWTPADQRAKEARVEANRMVLASPRININEK